MIISGLTLVLHQHLSEIRAKILTLLKLNGRFGIDVSISKIFTWRKHYPSHIVLKCHEAQPGLRAESSFLLEFSSVSYKLGRTIMFLR